MQIHVWNLSGEFYIHSTESKVQSEYVEPTILALVLLDLK